MQVVNLSDGDWPIGVILDVIGETNGTYLVIPVPKHKTPYPRWPIYKNACEIVSFKYYYYKLYANI